MKLKRVMIAAPKSGSGKTMITCALLQALKNAGQEVASYKCGPDYIDPMFHAKVIGVPSKNLDTFFTGEEKTRELFLQDRTEKDIAVLESVMGLFDGLGGVREEGSSYHLAKVTQTPIILVVDAKGMGRSVVPMIAGFKAYDKDGLIKGVILNRMSKSYYEIIKPLIEAELSVSVVGYFPEHKEFGIDSRHLGLMLPDEVENIKERIQAVAEEFQKTVSMERIMQLAEGAVDWEEEAFTLAQEEKNQNSIKQEGEKTDDKKTAGEKQNGPIIAVAKDEAFCFYYEDNLLLLQELGAKLEYFSPIHDKKLPDGCSGLLIGGGYPELYAQELSANEEMLKEIKSALNKGMPVVAECGGFMYLHSAITDKEMKVNKMVGAIEANCHYTGKLVRFGYIELEETQNCFLKKGEKIRGHEFHYFDSENNGEDCLATKPVTGKQYSCVMVGENYWMGFPHLYYPSNPSFAESFVEKAGKYKRKKK